VKHALRNRLHALLLESFIHSSARIGLSCLAIAIRLQGHADREAKILAIPLALLQEKMACSPMEARSAIRRLADPPSLVVIPESFQDGGEIALAAPVWEARSEIGEMMDAYLAAVDAFGRLSPPQDRLECAFLQARICFNLGLYFEAHEILEHEWLRQAKGPLHTFLQGIIQVSVGFYHGRRGVYSGAVNQLGKGLEKLRRTLAEFPDADADGFRRAVEGVRERLLARGREGMAPLEPSEIPTMTMDLPASLRALQAGETLDRPEIAC